MLHNRPTRDVTYGRFCARTPGSRSGARCAWWSSNMPSKSTLASSSVLAVAGLLTGCLETTSPGPPPPQPVLVHVIDDPGSPLEGVEVRAGGGPASITDASGVARLELQGHEGTT